MNTWFKVRIQQNLTNGIYVYSIHINDVEAYRIANTKPEDFNNVVVYVGNPWMDVQKGKIRNLIINTEPEKGNLYARFYN